MNVVLAAALAAVGTHSLHSEEIVILKSGLTRQGLVANLPSMSHNPFGKAGGGVKALPIMMVDDGLRRTYFHQRGMVTGGPNPVRGPEQSIEFQFKPPLNGKAVAGLGAIKGASPFNEYGRRRVIIRGPKGSDISVLQGITSLGSRYAKVQALKDTPTYKWDMRVATSSLDSKTLNRIFRRRLMKPNLNQNDLFDMHLQHVRFFIDSKRYADAHDELEETIRLFPNQQNMQAQLVDITERQAAQLIDEATQRAKVGQEPFAKELLKAFPLAAVGRVTRLEVQDALDKLDQTDKKIDNTVEKLFQQAGKLKPNQTAALGPILEEIKAGLSAATLPRMGDYILNSNVETTPLESRVSLGISGWLLGSGNGIQNLSVVTDMIKVRDLVYEYLGTDNAGRRDAILEALANLEGAEADYVSKMLPLLLPPKRLPPEAADETIPGMYIIGNDATAETPRTLPRYEIQLPPNYDPLREYPCIVALHPPSAAPSYELNWWSGAYNPNLQMRGGHGARHGYIVIAPAWTRPGQGAYEYTPREHQRVLVSLRDAMRRTSIDADRVFLVGHGEGATAAWDIAVSHPDIWAGMIAVRPDPDKTLLHYSDNARHVPIYIVLGELDGVRSKNNHAISGVFDQYVNVHADTMVTMYQGWGFSSFFEEIHSLYDWMNSSLHRRQAIPQEIQCKTMRHGDEFFWWLELDGIKPEAATDPIMWHLEKRIRGKIVEASVGSGNVIRISQAPTDRFIVWFRPDMGIDLNDRITIRYGSRPFYHEFDGEIKTMLEDARQRADRKRPYWSRIVIP